MDQLPTPVEGIPHRPLMLWVEHEPRPAVRVGYGLETAVDVTATLIRLEVVLDDIGCRVLIDARCDLRSFGFPVQTIMQPTGGLDGLTARELDEVVANKGYSESVGEAILEHLATRDPAGG